MAPQVMRRDRTPGTPAAQPEAMSLVSPDEAALRAKLKDLRAHLTQTADYVGQGFADEARRMHLGETDRRSIYGEATPDDARALIEEGVEILPLPALPDERN